MIQQVRGGAWNGMISSETLACIVTGNKALDRDLVESTAGLR